ncbi:hypothetical protein J7F03_02800 [Streptomyces sp. ISL-43]|uniref:hypothetical protein n=1 Tax=Streptomyces sp. ISL-43 TaxID=2819183 RepID=UPI001BE56DA8|nr:hypothetical protein [Streptomyces sp. ISL-43]MBT2446033.1 hypothetical protein [Streptomyces sp. ISL-43]
MLRMHSGATVAVGLARGAGVNYEEIGRGLAMLEDAGILIQRAASLLLALPAANHAIETTFRHQATLEGLSQAPATADGVR